MTLPCLRGEKGDRRLLCGYLDSTLPGPRLDMSCVFYHHSGGFADISVGGSCREVVCIEGDTYALESMGDKHEPWGTPWWVMTLLDSLPL